MALNARDMIPFPPGDNATDTIIANVHFNLTTLQHWNYTYFANGTLSNTSWCFLAFEPYTPTRLIPNGTFYNSTWCFSPTEDIGVHAGVAIGYAVLYGIALVMTLICLNKHGKLHLPAEKRFFPIGRRWQWYWGSWVCATAMISLLVRVDVDRYFLPELPVILTSFFWYIMQMGAIALVWEAVRHWGSWMERQFIDPDPFLLKDGDKRYMIELLVPLAFYLFLWLNFFMIIPRNWNPIQHQRYPQQTINDAEPTATDDRFKAAAFLLIGCWLITGFYLRHSIKYYCPRNRGVFNRVIGFVRYTPLRFMILIPLAASIIAYQTLVAYHFEYSPLKVDGLTAAIFAGGYTPALLILYTQILFGFLNPNEDRELQRQRRVRAQALDREMGIVKKPGWWARINGEIIGPEETMRDRLMRNVREVHGNKAAPPAGASPSTDGANEPVEMTPVSPVPPAVHRVTSPVVEPYMGRSERRRQDLAMQRAAGLLFPEAAQTSAADAARRREELMLDGPPPPAYTDAVRPGPRAAPDVSRSISAQSSLAGSTNQPPQQIRSMLDV